MAAPDRRPREDWPDVTPQQVPTFDRALLPPDAPLSPLAQALVSVSLELAQHFGQPVPDIKDPPSSPAPRDSWSSTKQPVASSPT